MTPDPAPRPPEAGGQHERRRVSTGQLAARARPVLDLPPRTARLIALAGAAGVVLVAVGSLSGNRPETIAVDKLLHFSGYATLAALAVLGLTPRRYAIALGALAALGAAIELLQPLNTRSRDPLDLLANLLGIAVGAAVGLLARLAYGYLKGEPVSARVRRRLVRLPAGTVIVSEGTSIDHFFIVRQGVVELSRATPDGQVILARAEAGAMFGLLAEVRRIPQYTTAVALTPVELYPLDFDELIAAAGGREQPLGIVLEGLAADLHGAWEQLAELQGGVDAGRRAAGAVERGSSERFVEG